MLPTTTLLAHWRTQRLVRSWPIAFQVMRTLSRLVHSMLLTRWPQWRLDWTTTAEQVVLSSMSGAQNPSSLYQERWTPEQLKRVLRLGWPWHSSHRQIYYHCCAGEGKAINLIGGDLERNNVLFTDLTLMVMALMDCKNNWVANLAICFCWISKGIQFCWASFMLSNVNWPVKLSVVFIHLWNGSLCLHISFPVFQDTSHWLIAQLSQLA